MPAPQPTTPLMATLRRGLRGRCPRCGEGRMFRAFLKVADCCKVCGQELFHQRADDFPAYLVIVIVGHIVAPMILLVETIYAPPIWVHAALWVPLILGLTIGLLQPVKGAVVAIQWYLGLEGFGEARQAKAALAVRREAITRATR